MRIFIVLLLLQFTISSKCPASCKCDHLIKSFCIYCVKSYRRSYDASTNTCLCTLGYIESILPSQYCCPQHCLTCNPQSGCNTCRYFWTLVFNQTDNIYDCTCKPNYYYNNTEGDCVCKSSLNDSTYYSPSPFECYTCPLNASCNTSSCQVTNNSILVSTINIYQNRICSCSNTSLYLSFDGTQCLAIANSYSTKFNQFDCLFPWTRTLDSCECNMPYTFQSGQCVCSSVLDPNKYYSVKNVCYFCPPFCNCSINAGCSSCLAPNRKITPYYGGRYILNTCFCVTPAVQINLTCVCIQPYNIDCTCLSNLYPQNYYSYNDSDDIQICKACPNGCKCDITGCYYCNTFSNRNVSNNCDCNNLMIQIDSTCMCRFPYILMSNTCICDLSTYFYLDPITNSCQICPTGCNCSSILGCHYCLNSTYRTISLINQSIYICTCNFPLQQTSDNLCNCTTNYQWNSTAPGTCNCILPFITMNGTNCICSAPFYPTQYSLTYTCSACPQSCTCNQYGCIYCDPLTFRVITPLNSTYFTCPCLARDASIFRLSDTSNCKWTCVQSNYYYWNQTCSPCGLNCLTCIIDVKCSSCQPGYSLTVNNTCSCTNDSTSLYQTNYQGICTCPLNYFNSNTTCILCPQNCRQCNLRSYQINENLYINFGCTACYVNVFRIVDPNKNCPCLPFYFENPNGAGAFCCHFSCLDCDASGCTSCPAISYRTLNKTDPNNITCKCDPVFLFLETYQTKCSCMPNTYYLNLQCVPCPNDCPNCTYVNYFYNCSTVCSDNRISTYQIINDSIYYSCDCPNGTLETSPISTFCYPQYCIDTVLSQYCKICSGNRVPNNDKTKCVCSDSYYTDEFQQCSPCLTGCLQCSDNLSCDLCDQNREYFNVVGYNKCIQVQFNNITVYQSLDQIVLRIQINKASDILQIQGVSLLSLNKYSGSGQNFTVTSFRSLNNLLIIYLQNPLKVYSEYQNYVFNVTYMLRLLNLNSQPQQTLFLRLPADLYNSYQLYDQYQNIENIAPILIYISMFISLLIAQNGLKHNQIMFFLQTMYFLSFNLLDKQMIFLPLLYVFRFSVFKFSSQHSYSPLDNLNPDWYSYLEYSRGNQNNLCFDANIVRNIGFLIFLIAIVIGLRLILTIIYYILGLNRYSINQTLKIINKILYRFNQFVFKICMYPIIYYSLQTFNLYDVKNGKFGQISLIIAIVCFLVVTGKVILVIFGETVSRLYKWDMLLEWVADIFMSIILIFTVYQDSFLAIILVFIARGTFQIVLRYRYELLFEKAGYFRILAISFEIIIMFIIRYWKNSIAVEILIIFTVVSHILVSLAVLKQQYKNYKHQNKAEIEKNVTQSQGVIIENVN